MKRLLASATYQMKYRNLRSCGRGRNQLYKTNAELRKRPQKMQVLSTLLPVYLAFLLAELGHCASIGPLQQPSRLIIRSHYFARQILEW